MASAAPAAKSIRRLRQEADKFLELVNSPLSKSPAPDMAGITDKLTLLKLVIDPICDDVDAIINMVLEELDVISTSPRAVAFVKITKAI